MAFVIQASKFSKIFCIRDWQQRCLADPQLIHKEEPFKIVIPRSAGGITLEHRVPVDAGTLLPRLTTFHRKDGTIGGQSQTRVQGDDEVRNLVPWLTGGSDGQQFMETDRWGVVELPIAADFVNMQADFFSQEAMIALYPERAAEAEEKRKKIQAKMRSSMHSAIKLAVERADERVIRAIKNVYKNFYAQNRTNLENGAGKIMPTDAEKLVAFYLHEHLKQKSEAEKEMMTKVREVMNQNVVGG